jgi:hypothetical protein
MVSETPMVSDDSENASYKALNSFYLLCTHRLKADLKERGLSALLMTATMALPSIYPTPVLFSSALVSGMIV